MPTKTINEKLKLTIICQKEDIQSSIWIAINAGGRLIEVDDFDKLSQESLVQFGSFLQQRCSFYLGDLSISPETQLKLAQKLKELSGLEVRFDFSPGAHFILSRSGNSIGIIPSNGRTKVDAIVLVPIELNEPSPNRLIAVLLDSKEKDKYVPNTDLDNLQAIAKDNGRSIAGVLQTIMDLKTIEENKPFAILVDSRDAREIFNTAGFYKIDRRNGKIKKIDNSEVLSSSAWHEVIHITDNPLGAIKAGRPVFLVSHDDWSANRIRINPELPMGYRTCLVLAKQTTLEQRIVEARRTELMDEVAEAEEEKRLLTSA